MNSIHACLHLHSKAAMLQTSIGQYFPNSFVSDDPALLLAKISEGGEWVVKPTAGSFGRDVFEVHVGLTNLRQIVETLSRQGYVLVQQRVSTEKERRWFLAAGEVIGVYQKVKSGFRGNLANDAEPELISPSAEESRFLDQLAERLMQEGIGACAVDVAYPFLLDVNFINPGFFQTMEKLTGEDLSLKLPALFEAASR